MATGDIRAFGVGGPAENRPVPSLEAPSPRYGEKVIRGLLALCALLSVLTTTAIVVSLLLPTIDFLAKVPIADFLFGTSWAPTFTPADFGVLPILVGTLST
ncbi:MAG: phosphate ABC transporter permease subunit PstC, partial [Solirubrobacterales bacterium]